VYFDDVIAGSDEYRRMARRGEQAAFERFAAPLDTAGIPVRPLFEESSTVANAVDRIAESAGADLIVMGSRGQSRSAGILLGSESDHMLMEAKLPVLITKRRGERIGLLQALLDRDLHVGDPPRFG
jgi:nucleotide-binding universal stress UspA family protein